ncbi:MAG: phosphotransferase [Tissierellia bacterium]|nr:phosphotransferase [Tissierellia bacterium]
MLKDRLLPDLRLYIDKRKLEIFKNKNQDYNIEFLAQGEYNINYIIEADKKMVLRINTGSQLEIEDQISYEYKALKFLSSSGVTPKVSYLDNTKSEIPYGLLLMEFLEGRQLDYNLDLKRAAWIFSRIHSMDISRENDFIVESNPLSSRVIEGKYWLRDILDRDYLNKEQNYFFKKFISLAEKNLYKEQFFNENRLYVVNNTEVNSSNFIIGDRDYLIDWEKPVISDPTQDITQFLAPTTTLWKTDIILSDQQREEFFKEYTTKMDCKFKDIRLRVELYLPYLYLRALTWCAYAYIAYKNSDKEILNPDTKEKLDIYMDEEFRYSLIGPLGTEWRIL